MLLIKVLIGCGYAPFVFAPLLQGPVGPLPAAAPCKAAWGPRLGVGIHLLRAGITLGV